MDLKKYFTDEELNNMRPRIIRQFSSKDKLNDGFGVRDYNADNHWRDCDEEFSLLGKKTILILPGSGAQSAKQANGMCKIAEDLLPEAQKDKWQICSMHYEGDDMGKIPMVIRATDLLDNYLVPLFTTKDKEGDLHKIDAQTAAQNLRNVVIFTHCYGGYVGKEIERKMSELMTEIGYTDRERDNIMKQMIVIQHNNIDTNISEYFTSAIGRWIQKSIDDNQMDLFDKIMTTQSTFFANVTPDLWSLDYINADNKALCKIIPQIYNTKTYPLQKEGYSENFSGCNFVRNLVTTYAAIDKRAPSEESQTAKKMLENILFKELSLEPEVKEAVLQKSEELGVTKLQRMAKNNWQAVNTDNMLVVGGHERR